MDSPLVARDSFEDPGQKLRACEENLRRHHQLALAGRLVGATSLNVRITMRHPNAIITIADNGTGIPASVRQTLFDSFKSNKAEGNGLGLWIVREIVHGHGGTIRYRSSDAPNRSGTIFRISLPIQKAA
jgi:signal transduction histidine kinase